jgi:hypothetical protein
MGPTPTAILQTVGAPVLLLEPDLRRGQAIVALYDGNAGSDTALNLAAALGQKRAGTPVIVGLRGSEGHLAALENAAENELRRIGFEGPVRFFRLGRDDTGLLARLTAPRGIGLLILPRAGALGEAAGNALAEARCPILVVREPATERA